MSERKKTEPEIKSINEMKVLHPGEWILAKVTRWNWSEPIDGEVLEHDEDESKVVARLVKEHEEHPEAKFAYFFGNLPTPAA